MGGNMKGKTGLWLAAAFAALAVLMMLGAGGKQSASSQDERRIAEVLSAIDGAGRVEVALYGVGEDDGGFSGNTGPTGAVVVAQGAGDVQVRLQLIRAVRTLLGLAENAVDVFVMEEGQR